MTKKITAERETVLVTGGTQGIGLEFAKIFAKEGYDLILVARNEAKANQVAEQLKKKFSVQVTPLIQDLSEIEGAEKLQKMVEERGLFVDILINNAGFGITGDFVSTQLDYEIGMMRLNMETVVRLTKLFLPHMIGKKKGKILNVASTAAFQGGPHMAVYFATKAFVLSFSEALTEELKTKNITVTALCPGPTRTGFQAKAQQEQLTEKAGSPQDPFVVARAGFKGLMSGKALVVPGVKNAFFLFAERFLPRRTTTQLAGKFIQQLRNKDLIS